MLRALFNTFIISVIYFGLVYFIAGGDLNYQEWKEIGRVLGSVFYLVIIFLTYFISLDIYTRRDKLKKDKQKEEKEKKKIRKILKSSVKFKVENIDNDLIKSFNNALEANGLKIVSTKESLVNLSTKDILNGVLEENKKLQLFTSKEIDLIVSNINREQNSELDALISEEKMEEAYLLVSKVREVKNINKNLN